MLKRGYPSTAQGLPTTGSSHHATSGSLKGGALSAKGAFLLWVHSRSSLHRRVVPHSFLAALIRAAWGSTGWTGCFVGLKCPSGSQRQSFEQCLTQQKKFYFEQYSPERRYVCMTVETLEGLPLTEVVTMPYAMCCVRQIFFCQGPAKCRG
eukprot:scaffold133259_cov24-Tisochrysis_lutea.AAC.2